MVSSICPYVHTGGRHSHSVPECLCYACTEALQVPRWILTGSQPSLVLGSDVQSEPEQGRHSSYIQPIVESLEAVPFGPPRQRHLLKEMRILGTHYLLCTWCSVGPQFFFRRNYSLSRYNLVYSMEEVSSISSYVAVLHWNFCYVLDDPETRTAFRCNLGNRWISSADPRTSIAKGIYCTLGRVSKNEWLTFMEYFL